MSTKRRLALMPEVLPTPARSASPSTVRSRTLARLKVLAAVSAAGLAAGCSGKAISGSGAGTSGGGGGGGGGGGPFYPVDSPDSGGTVPYGVVDPLPAPACFVGAPPVTASYVEDLTDAGIDAGPDAGDSPDAGRDERVVAVMLHYVDPTVFDVKVDAPPPGMTILDASTTTTGGRIVVRAANGSYRLSVRLQCSGGAQTFEVTLEVHDDELSASAH